jgi:hypothetical protein
VAKRSAPSDGEWGWREENPGVDIGQVRGQQKGRHRLREATLEKRVGEVQPD